jgi:hypothetical protein
VVERRQNAGTVASGACRFLVISWWSNSLALTCLARLVAHAPEIPISVIHVGKPERQKALFRSAQPPGVEELQYPARDPGEHGAVLDHVLEAFRARPESLFCVDHDVFVEEPCGPWFERAAAEHLEQGHCMATPGGDGSRTSPAFLLVPKLVPYETPSFLPVPPRHSPAARAPYAYRRDGIPRRPVKDTLVEAREYLARRGLHGNLQITTVSREGFKFPRHAHVGGLHALAAPPLVTRPMPHPAYLSHLERALRNLEAFYTGCPADILSAEEPVLLERLEELRSSIRSMT